MSEAHHIVHAFSSHPPLCLCRAVLTGVVKHFRGVAASLPLLSQPIGALPVGTWALHVIRASPNTTRRQLASLLPSTPLITALTMLLQGHTSWLALRCPCSRLTCSVGGGALLSTP